MLVLIFENEEEGRKAAEFNWQYASWIVKTPYKEVTDALDKFN